MFLWRLLASLALAYKLHIRNSASVGTFGGLAPQYQKAGYATGGGGGGVAERFQLGGTPMHWRHHYVHYTLS